MSQRQTGKITVLSVVALFAIALFPKLAVADTVDIFDGLGFDHAHLTTFFTGKGDTVNQLTASFTSLAGANFVIIQGPTTGFTATQLSAIDTYVNGGGRLLINSEYVGFSPQAIADANTILTSLGSSIVNQSTSSNGGFHDTSDIVASPFTAGVTDVNYADTSSLTGGTALVFGNPVTDLGQEFIAYQAIGLGDVFVIADSNTADNINSTTTNNNGVMYCDFGGLACAATAPSVPEPNTLLLLGTRLLGVGATIKRKFFA